MGKGKAFVKERREMALRQLPQASGNTRNAHLLDAARVSEMAGVASRDESIMAKREQHHAEA